VCFCCWKSEAHPVRASATRKPRQGVPSPTGILDTPTFDATQNHYRNRSDENNTDVLVYLHRGANIIKLCRKRKKAHIRYFFLSNDNTRIMWREAESKGSNEQTRFVHISDIDKIESGVKSSTEAAARFESVKSFQTGNKTVPLDSMTAGQYFSIFYSHGKECLNLISLTASEASIWVWGLIELKRRLKKGETLSELKSLPYWFEHSQQSKTRSSNIPDVSATDEQVKELRTKISNYQKRLSKVSVEAENRETYQRCENKLNSLARHIESADPTNPIVVGDIRTWKVDLWKLEVDLGALELISMTIDGGSSLANS